ncbi:thioesterase II family protein [Amycolatopsis sp. NPDC005003]
MSSRPMPPPLLKGDPGAAHRVVLLHYAGGSAASLLPLAGDLPGSCAVALLELNDRDVPATTFAEAVSRIRPRFEALLDRPTTVFGHSMGALFAHALVTTLAEGCRRHVADVVFSGSRSPGTTRALTNFPRQAVRPRPRAELAGDLDRYGGCPPEVLADPQLLDWAVTALGQDMQLIDTYAETGVPLSGVRFHVWYGATDDEASEHEARRWAADLPGTPALQAFPGGHFYLLRHGDAGRALRRLVTTGRGWT